MATPYSEDLAQPMETVEEEPEFGQVLFPLLHPSGVHSDMQIFSFTSKP